MPFVTFIAKFVLHHLNCFNFQLLNVVFTIGISFTIIFRTDFFTSFNSCSSEAKTQICVEITSVGVFTVCTDKKFAKCHECAELVSRGGDNTKKFNTTNLVTHLKVNHPVVYNSFYKNKERKDSQRQVAKSGGFAALRQLTLEGSQDRVKVWDINDPRATTIHRKLGEMIALDYQPIPVVEDVGFLRFVGALEPRYKVPSRKYMTETVLNKINVGIKGELMKLHAPGVE